jgi:hypothetical protein
MRQWAISTFNTLVSIYCLLLAEKIAGIEVDFLFPYGGKTLEWIYWRLHCQPPGQRPLGSLSYFADGLLSICAVKPSIQSL